MFILKDDHLHKSNDGFVADLKSPFHFTTVPLLSKILPIFCVVSLTEMHEATVKLHDFVAYRIWCSGRQSADCPMPQIARDGKNSL